MNFISKFIEKHFLITILFFAALGLIFPDTFSLLKSYIPFILGLIMLGMGLTIDFKDLKDVSKNPKWLFVGVLLQFFVMPLLAFVIGKFLQLPQNLLVGLIIVGACPGGTASNVMVYLSKAHLPLSISLTLISTILAPILTPFWIFFLANESIDISFLSLAETTFWIVLFPLLDGLVIRKLFQKKIQPVIDFFPSISILSIASIVACVIALNKDVLATFPILIFIAVLLHNVFGFLIGYMVPTVLQFPKKVSKTIAIEVGMQNSGLGVSLALVHFSKITALPAVIFSIWHNLAGIIVAKIFKRQS